MVQQLTPPPPAVLTPTAFEQPPSSADLQSFRQEVTDAKFFRDNLKPAGFFVLRRPNGKDMMAIGKTYTRILEGQYTIDPEAQFLARVFATIEGTAESKPPGWDWEQMQEFDDIPRFWEAYQKWMSAFRSPSAA